MAEADLMQQSVDALQTLNEAVLSKLDGLSEYDLRRPMTPTGSNLLGIVKHLASVQAGYFGDVFGRPWPEPMPWMGFEAEANHDMFATAAESSEWVRDFYRRSWVHALATFDTLSANDTGTVPWWSPDRRHPTLAAVLLHMTVETARHAGHLDIIRELIDGATGRFADDLSVLGDDEIDWVAYVAQVETEAVRAQEEERTP